MRYLLYLFILSLIIFIPFLEAKSEEKVVSHTKKTSINVTLVEKPLIKKVQKKVVKKKKPHRKPKPKKRSKVKPTPKKIVEPKPIPIKSPPPKVVEKKEIIEEVPDLVKELVVETQEDAPTEELVEEEPSKEQILASKKNLYFATIYEKISQYKKYPKKAKRLRQEGEIKVRFLVDAQGRVSDFEILDQSDFRLLNKAVKKMFKKLKTFDAPPSGLELPLEISITISYRLK